MNGRINFENVFYLTFGPLVIVAGAVICWVVERS